MTKKTKRIPVDEFDERFDRGEEISDAIDYAHPLSIDSIVSAKRHVVVDLGDKLLERVMQKSRELDLDMQSTIKAILAKEFGLL